MKEDSKPVCKRCATCCRKGGPALHGQDKLLVMEGHLPLDRLFTIRPAEPVLDNVTGRIIFPDSDIVKIKAASFSSACLFLEPASNTCSIYDQRPLECRVLECWQPEGLASIYNRNRLSRKDILMPKNPCLWNLVAEHQSRCDYSEVARLARLWLEGDKTGPAAALLEIMRYDTSLRQTCSREGGIAEAMLDFLFGLPLSVTIARFGLQLARSRKGKYFLITCRQHK